VVDPILLGFSFSAGAATFLNPCGFAMLPTYVSYYLGRGGSDSPSVAAGVLKGLGLGLLVTLGFILVFAVSGVLFSAAGTALARYIPWLAVSIGLLLIMIGGLLLFGKSIHLPFSLNIPINPRQKNVGSFFLFGVGYAIASLSCTIPLFLLVVLQAISTGGITSGLTVFFTYAVGMGLMMTTLSVAVGASKEGISKYLKRVTPYLGRISGSIIVLAGLYTVYFQVFVGRILLVLA
jgi:cytochrome c biogenesis protein CcdA